MNLLPFFKSIIDQDKSSVVVCNTEHEIIYMNDAARDNYKKWTADDLLGKSLLACHNSKSVEMIKKVVDWFRESTENNIIYINHNEKKNKDVYMVALRDNDGTLIGYYEKHEYRNAETAKLYDFK